MENYNLHRRAQSGWHPTTYSRPVDKKPERNYAAILAAAKRPPVGYWEDAPRGIQFGGGKTRSDQRERSAPVACPPAPSVSSDDLYEPIGTMPVVGDRLTFTHHGIQCAEVWAVDADSFQARIGCIHYRFQSAVDGYRILKRKQSSATGARAWKHSFGYHWLSIGVKWFAASPIGGWEQFPDNWLAGSAMAEWVELHGPEADAIIRECAKAMGLCPQKPE